MPVDNEVELTVHGLDVDNGKVRASVFLDKFRALLKALKQADRSINEAKAHEFLIVDLRSASAHASLKERSVKPVAPKSSVRYVGEVVAAIYNGDRNIVRFPKQIIQSLQPLVRGIGSHFSHAEIRFESGAVIRIDDYLEKQMSKAVRRLDGEFSDEPKNFEGIAIEAFDGIVKEMDARGSLVRGKLVLTVGSKELDCIFKIEDMELLRTSFDKRARVEGVAHYDGVSLLPIRVDVRRIEVTKEDADLVRWKKALKHRRVGGFDND